MRDEGYSEKYILLKLSTKQIKHAPLKKKTILSAASRRLTVRDFSPFAMLAVLHRLALNTFPTQIPLDNEE